MRLPFYTASPRGFEVEKDLSALLQPVVFGRTGTTVQNNLNKILERHIVPLLDAWCPQFPSVDLTGIQAKAVSLREQAGPSQTSEGSSAAHLVANVKWWDTQLAALTQADDDADRKDITLMGKAVRLYLRVQIVAQFVAQNPSAANFYLTDFPAELARDRSKDVPFVSRLNTALQRLDLATLLSADDVPPEIRIPLYHERPTQDVEVREEASRFFSALLGWPVEQVTHQLNALVPHFAALCQQGGEDLFEIQRPAAALQRQAEQRDRAAQAESMSPPTSSGKGGISS